MDPSQQNSAIFGSDMQSARNVEHDPSVRNPSFIVKL
jgi:hypothetical protein